MKRITILAAMHGMETYGIDLYDDFIKEYPALSKYVQLVIGNERAYHEKVRFIDADMNRQYASIEISHESKEIKRVERLIESFAPDYIIDIHTTKRDSGIFFISGEMNNVRKNICSVFPYDICVMKDAVINTSFIGHHNNAISLEYSLRSISDNTTNIFIKALSKIINEKTSLNHGKIYSTDRLVSKEEWLKYKGIKNYDILPEGTALMIPANNLEMDAEYYGFWCR